MELTNFDLLAKTCMENNVKEPMSAIMNGVSLTILGDLKMDGTMLDNLVKSIGCQGIVNLAFPKTVNNSNKLAISLEPMAEEPVAEEVAEEPTEIIDWDNVPDSVEEIAEPSVEVVDSPVEPITETVVEEPKPKKEKKVKAVEEPKKTYSLGADFSRDMLAWARVEEKTAKKNKSQNLLVDLGDGQYAFDYNGKSFMLTVRVWNTNATRLREKRELFVDDNGELVEVKETPDIQGVRWLIGQIVKKYM